MLNSNTLNFYQTADLNDRKAKGQYMTPFNICDKALNIDLTKYNKILEPSCGTGQFIDSIIKKKSNAKITGVEFDDTIFQSISKIYKTNKNIKLINHDFLNWETEEKFDLIVGNPPYFEFKPSSNIKKLYGDVICGRANIYSLFIKKSIDLLNPNGLLIFVIPTSILSSAYFKNIRNYIVQFCNIEKIEILNTDDFEDAQQQTMVFQLKKLGLDELSDGKYIVNINETVIFNNEYEQINLILKDKKFVKDLGCSVKTGSIVWNQHKDELEDDETDDNHLLVYPRNLSNGSLVLSSHDKKKQYLNTDKIPILAPVIAINRIIGVKDISLNPVLIKTGKYHFENHVNVITGKLKNLEKIYKSFKKPETVKFIKRIIGNTQLSKNELEQMVPIFE